MRRGFRFLVVIVLAAALLLPTASLAAEPQEKSPNFVTQFIEWLLPWLSTSEASPFEAIATEPPAQTNDTPEAPTSDPPNTNTDDPEEGDSLPDLNPDG